MIIDPHLNPYVYEIVGWKSGDGKGKRVGEGPTLHSFDGCIATLNPLSESRVPTVHGRMLSKMIILMSVMMSVSWKV